MYVVFCRENHPLVQPLTSWSILWAFTELPEDADAKLQAISSIPAGFAKPTEEMMQ